MGVYIFDIQATDFSTHGIGKLNPFTCTVTETLNGDYSLELRHPYDDAGMWKELMCGRVLRAPVPSSVTPQITVMVDKQATYPVWKVNVASGKRLYLYNTDTGGKRLASYKKGAKVTVTDTTGTTYYKVITADGKTGYMALASLTDTGTTVTVKTGQEPKTIDGTQVRDQPFRIYKVEKTMEYVTVSARHIFYDLAYRHFGTWTPFNDVTGASAMDSIVRYNTGGSYTRRDEKGNISQFTGNMYKAYGVTLFTTVSDMNETYAEHTGSSVSDEYAAEISRKTLVECIMDSSCGVLAQWGGELFRDWYTVYYMKKIGVDRTDSYVIRYGVNMTGITYTEDFTNVVTHLEPYGKTADGDPLSSGSGYIVSDNWKDHKDTYPFPCFYALDCQSECEVGKKYNNVKLTEAKAKEKLISLAKAKMETGIDLPQVTVDVNFIDLSRTDAYKDYAYLQNLYIGDTVTAVSTRHGIKESLRMTQYVYDCLKEQYDTITLGSTRDTLDSAISRSN